MLNTPPPMLSWETYGVGVVTECDEPRPPHRLLQRLSPRRHCGMQLATLFRMPSSYLY
jgi:hypothetical protein